MHWAGGKVLDIYSVNRNFDISLPTHRETKYKIIMKKTYHLCLSGGDEIMFRDIEDYNRGFNCFALALHKTGSTGLVETFMSTHTHQLVQTADPAEFMCCFRLPYTMYFNRKYGRRGGLGEKKHFTMEIDGYYHTMAAASYVLRNALHHGVAPIPYAYPHCSANSIFMKDMGKHPDDRLLQEKYHHRFLGKTAEYPVRYKMSESGIFLRESVLDIPQVENLFVTPRMFNFYMTRKSSEEWKAEQGKDQNGISPIGIEQIERGVRTDAIDKMLMFENGKADYKKMSDIELCTEIDKVILPTLGKTSVYCMSEKEKCELAEHLYRQRHIGPSQIRRALAM